MNCKNVSNNISSFIDDEMSPNKRSLILEHLDRCKDCDKSINQYTEIDNVIKYNSESLTLSDDFELRLKYKLIELGKVSSRFRMLSDFFENTLYRRLSYGVALFIFVSLTFIFINNSFNKSTTNNNLVVENIDEDLKKPKDISNISTSINNKISPTIASPVSSKVLIEYVPNRVSDAVVIDIDGEKYNLGKNSINLDFNKDDVDKVITYYDPFMRVFVPEICYSFGLKLIKLGRLDEGIDYLKKVITMDPDSSYAKDAKKQLQYMKIKENLNNVNTTE